MWIGVGCYHRIWKTTLLDHNNIVYTVDPTLAVMAVQKHNWVYLHEQKETDRQRKKELEVPIGKDVSQD